MSDQLKEFVKKIRSKSAHTTYRTKDGTKVSSVTTIIGQNLGWNKQILIAWTRKMYKGKEDPEKILEDAGSTGTIAHYLIECDIKGIEPDLSPFSEEFIEIAYNGYNAFKDWEREFKPEYVHSELQLVSEKYKYGGTIDLVLRVDGKLCIYDFKTSNGIYSEMFIQVAAYRNMFEEIYGEKIEHCAIIKLSKEEAEYELHHIPQVALTKGWSIFKALLITESHRKYFRKLKV